MEGLKYCNICPGSFRVKAVCQYVTMPLMNHEEMPGNVFRLKQRRRRIAL